MDMAKLTTYQVMEIAKDTWAINEACLLYTSDAADE